MATTDSNGIVFLEETDPISPFHTTMNTLQQGTSDTVTNLKADAETLAAAQGAWVSVVNSTTFQQDVTGDYILLSGMSQTVTVPPNRTLEVELFVPIVDLPAITGTQPTISAQVNGGSWVILNGAYLSNSNANAFGIPLFLRSTYRNTTSTAQTVVHRAMANKIGTGAYVRFFHGSGFPVRYRYIIR